MAYNNKEGYPQELANKVGHVKLIQDQLIQNMIESFEDIQELQDSDLPSKSGSFDLNGDCSLKQVITVDGGHQTVPNAIRPERQVGFIQVAAQLIKLETIEYFKKFPMLDPRDVRKSLRNLTHHTLAVLPLSGVNLPGHSVKRSIREVLHRFIKNYQLYDALSFLVFRQWEDEPTTDPPSMDCLNCGSLVILPRNQLKFKCLTCRHEHKLADYLGLTIASAEDRPRTEIVSNFRTVLENLVLFSSIIKYRNTPIINETLFLLDGPLTLRAQLYRLVEPIRDFLAYQRNIGRPIHLLGVEKTGELSDFAASISKKLEEPGDYFLPTTQFVVEDIYGRSFHEESYRNRVNYGAKVIVRLGKNHIITFNAPTGEFILSPDLDDLIGFKESCRLLSKLISYSFENALMPIVLVNAEASISNTPSGGILAQFVDRILQSNGT